MTREEAIAEMKKTPAYGLGYTDGIMVLDNFIQSLKEDEPIWSIKTKTTSFIITELNNFYRKQVSNG